MPWTRRQVKYLLSKGSPLTDEQQDKMKAELHADPEMGHARKGGAELKKARPQTHMFNWRNRHGQKKVG